MSYGTCKYCGCTDNNACNHPDTAHAGGSTAVMRYAHIAASLKYPKTLPQPETLI
jgi:hypothetical protein